MKRLGLFLLGTAMLAVVLAVGFVPRQAYEGLSVGQVVRSIPITWETTDPDTYTLIECVDPRDDYLSL